MRVSLTLDVVWWRGFAMSKANKIGSTYLFDTFEGFRTEEEFHKKEHFIYKDIDEVKRNIKT